MATLCRTEFLATEDLVVWFGLHRRQVVDLGTGYVHYVSSAPTAKVVVRRPNGTIYVSEILPTVAAAFQVVVPVADYVQGNWIVVCQQEDSDVISDQDTIVASWGVAATATVAANEANTQLQIGGEVFENVKSTRQLNTNKIEANSSTTPTGLRYFADDGVTVLATRTIANADGTPVSPSQVLNLGSLL